MNSYKRYIVSTGVYAICGLIGIDSVIVFATQQNWFLTILAILFTYVSLDNLFCGRRAKACASRITTHYIIPWRIKRKN